MAKEPAIILHSGSLKSAVLTGIASQKYRPVLVHVEAFERPGSRIRGAYDQQVAFFKPFREHTVPMPHLATVTRPRANSVISDPRVAQDVGPQLIDLLPMVAAAMQFAVHYEAKAIYVGMCASGHEQTLSRVTEYLQIFAELVQLPAAKPEIEIIAPLLELEPWQVVDVGFQVSAPLAMTWSCVDDRPDPCGTCRGCRWRSNAFEQAVKKDPLLA